jgi:hypothetical protein
MMAPASHDPVRDASQADPHAALFAVFAAPIAWFVQLCGSYSLASAPCFRDGHRATAVPAGSQWTGAALLALMAAAVLIALVAAFLSWRAFSRTKAPMQGETDRLTRERAGRTHFLALWGVVFGAAFALAAALTGFDFVALPRCAG